MDTGKIIGNAVAFVIVGAAAVLAFNFIVPKAKALVPGAK